MNPQLINIALMPPEKPGSEYDETQGKIEELLNWVRKTYKPEDLFEEDILGEWAERNGYVKIENDLPLHEGEEFKL